MAAPRTFPPPLESGDHLSRDEFHRRYLEHPEIKRAELVEGIVFVSSPASNEHSVPHSTAVGWLFAFKARTPGLGLAVDGTLFLPTGDEVQPDACLYRLPPAGAVRLRTMREGDRPVHYLEGAPELIFEVAVSSASYDLHSKKRAYERAGVQEYIVWQIYEGRIDWFSLRDGRYTTLDPDEHGAIESRVFPGLRLAVQSMLDGNDAAVLDALSVSPT